MMAATKIIIGIAVILISIFMLFFIFDRMNQLGEQCQIPDQRPAICDKFTGPTEAMIFILLIISGFIIMITATGYILLSSK